MSDLTVKIAVYGATLANGTSQAADVTQALQNAINKQGTVVINNANMGIDPSPGNVKSFGAVVLNNGVPQDYACQENQSINFAA